MLYILSYSIGHSRNAGLASAAGLATGGLVLVVSAALGLATLFAVAPFVYMIVKILGAIYLIYLGIQMLLEKESADNETRMAAVRKTPLSKIFLQGVLVEILNPKTVLFFVAFLPQFVDGELGSVGVQMLILGLLVPLTAVPSDMLVAFTGGTIARNLARNRTASKLLNWLGGLFLIGLGVRLFIVE